MLFGPKKQHKIWLNREKGMLTTERGLLDGGALRYEKSTISWDVSGGRKGIAFRKANQEKGTSGAGKEGCPRIKIN